MQHTMYITLLENATETVIDDLDDSYVKALFTEACK